MHIQAEQSSDGGNISEQCLYTKTHGITWERLGLKCESKIRQSSSWAYLVIKRLARSLACKLIYIYQCS